MYVKIGLCNLDHFCEKYYFASTKKILVTVVGGDLQSWQGTQSVWIAQYSLIPFCLGEIRPFPACAPCSHPSAKSRPLSSNVKSKL